MSRTRVFALAALVALATAGLSPASAATFASAEQVQAMRTVADWLDQLSDRMERRGKSLSDADARSMRMVNAQLTKFDRILKSTSGSNTSGVLIGDALEVQDQLAQLWLNVRATQGYDDAGSGVAPAPAPAPAAPAAQFFLPANTRGLVQITTWLSSRNAQVGDRFSAILDDPIYSGGKVVVPAGAVFEGFVSEVDRAGRASDAGKLHLFIDRLRGEQGQIADLRALVVGTASGDELKAKGVNAGRTAAVGAVGAVVGGILGGKKGALIGATAGAGGTLLAERGKDVDVPQGTLLRIEIQDGVLVPWVFAGAGG